VVSKNASMGNLTFFREDTSTQDSDRGHDGWDHRCRMERCFVMHHTITTQVAGQLGETSEAADSPGRSTHGQLSLDPLLGTDHSRFPGQMSGKGDKRYSGPWFKRPSLHAL